MKDEEGGMKLKAPMQLAAGIFIPPPFVSVAAIDGDFSPFACNLDFTYPSSQPQDPLDLRGYRPMPSGGLRFSSSFESDIGEFGPGFIPRNDVVGISVVLFQARFQFLDLPSCERLGRRFSLSRVMDGLCQPKALVNAEVLCLSQEFFRRHIRPPSTTVLPCSYPFQPYVRSNP